MKKIKTGKVEIGEDEFNPKKGKFRVNMFVDLDVIDEIRKIAGHEHMPYQTWINRKLREIVEGVSSSKNLTVEELREMMEEIIEERVDKKVLKKIG